MRRLTQGLEPGATTSAIVLRGWNTSEVIEAYTFLTGNMDITVQLSGAVSRIAAPLGGSVSTVTTPLKGDMS